MFPGLTGATYEVVHGEGHVVKHLHKQLLSDQGSDVRVPLRQPLPPGRQSTEGRETLLLRALMVSQYNVLQEETIPLNIQQLTASLGCIPSCSISVRSTHVRAISIK